MGDDAARKARWEKAGRPLFGKFYTKQEIEAYNNNPAIKLKGRRAQPHAHLETPAEWPKDTVIDPGQWVYWLPEGWKQGIRTSATGKTLKCYFTPDHWRFWHRKDIEKEGYELGAAEPPRKNKENKEEEEKRIRYVTDHDAVPNWPDEGWLPDDWRLGMRALPSGLMRIFQPPNQEEGFFFHKSQVLEYLSGGSPSLTAISASMTMEERLGFQPRKKRKKSQATYASLADYSEVKGFSILKLPASEKELKPFGADGKKLVAGCREIEEGLLRRKFKDVQLLLALKKKTLTSSLLDAVQGIFYRRPDVFCGKPYYQQIQIGPHGHLICTELHVFWSSTYSCWKIGALSEEKAGFLRHAEESPSPWEVKTPWMLVKESLCRPGQ